MGPIESGIDRVRIFRLASGVRQDGSGLAEPFCAIVMWWSEYQDKLHQVYVNGEFAGATSSAAQRRLVVPLPASARAVRVEVYAVEQNEAYTDFSAEMDEGQKGRVRLSWGRRNSLPYEGRAKVYGDGGGGNVNYDEPVSKDDIRLWPSWQEKGGLGLSRFGEGDFGYDGCAAVGFGRGGFGVGEYGFDADVMRWVSGELETGAYRFGIETLDESGAECGTAETDAVTVVQKARGADGLGIESFDSATNQLVLGIG